LEYFDVVEFAEEPTPEDTLYRKILHLYLDERDNRPPSMSEAKPNGFTEGLLPKVTTTSFRLKAWPMTRRNTRKSLRFF